MRKSLITGPFRSFFDRFRLLLRLGPVAVAVDRPEVAIVVGPAMGQGQDVVDLMRFTHPTQARTLIATAYVLITLQDALTLASPRAPATARTLTGSPGLGLLSCQLRMSVAVTVGIAVQ